MSGLIVLNELTATTEKLLQPAGDWHPDNS